MLCSHLGLGFHSSETFPYDNMQEYIVRIHVDVHVYERMPEDTVS